MRVRLAQVITGPQASCAPVLDLGANHHRIFFALRHLGQGHAELLGQERSSDLDEAQVGNVMHDPAAVGVEKHHLHFGANARAIGRHEGEPITRLRKIDSFT